MGSSPDFVEYVVDQLDAELEITSRKMFGEYGLYSGEKLFALVCDDRLFVKPTEPGRRYIGDVVEAPPYPGARPSFLIGDGIEDGAWLSELVRLTVAALPEPTKKGKKKGRKKD